MSERERFLASCQQEADSVLVDGQSVTIYKAVERPLDEKSGQRLADLANSAGLSGMVRSNIIHLRLKEGERVDRQRGGQTGAAQRREDGCADQLRRRRESVLATGNSIEGRGVVAQLPAEAQWPALPPDCQP